jgi:hypothetical protein
MTEAPRIVYRLRELVAPEVELSTLANIYALALQKHIAKHEATRPGSPDDGTEVKEDSAHEHRST